MADRVQRPSGPAGSHREAHSLAVVSVGVSPSGHPVLSRGPS